MSNKAENVFSPADILLPKGAEMNKWAVIACDQFTSQPDYWHEARRIAGSRSTLSMILPEAELGEGHRAQRIEAIHAAMEKEAKTMVVYPQAYVYVERTLLDGRVRRGVVGMIDLEAYDYHDNTTAEIRATEKTVVERIPPRMEVRRGAALDLPHVILLCDDERDVLLGYLEKKKESLPVLYDFNTMLGGGHMIGRLVSGADAQEFSALVEEYERSRRMADEKAMLYAVGDGNHSLATAKSCYDELKAVYPSKDLSVHPMRYALLELQNIRDDSQTFEPIHRVVMGTDAPALLEAAQQALSGLSEESRIGFVSEDTCGELTAGKYPVGTLQKFLDRYLADHPGEIDYIHGEDVLRQLAVQPDCAGFLLPAMNKGELFATVQGGDALPRKTFSMGHAQEKRYYLEARSLR